MIEFCNNNNNNKALKLERKKERNKTVSNRVDGESYEKLKDILRKDKKEIGDWLQDKIEDEIKVHGDGNPVYTLDHFNEDNFLATPSFHRPMHIWKSYLTKCSDTHYKDWYIRLDELLNLERKVTHERATM